MVDVEMTSSLADNPLIPTSIIKRQRTEDGARATDIADESLSYIQTSANNDPQLSQRRIVKAIRRSASKLNPEVKSENPLIPAVSVSGGPVGIVSVKGSSKVQRCTRCKTFIKAGAAHSIQECDARIARKAANAGKPRARGVRKFRMTPKRRAALLSFVADATKIGHATKIMARVEKWITKKERKLTKHTKKLFGDLIGVFHQDPDAKKFKTNLRKAGL